MTNASYVTNQEGHFYQYSICDILRRSLTNTLYVMKPEGHFGQYFVQEKPVGQSQKVFPQPRPNLTHNVLRYHLTSVENKNYIMAS